MIDTDVMSTGISKAATVRPPLGLTLQRRRQIVGVLFTLPAVVLLVAFFLVPLGKTFWMSLNAWPILGTHHYIGFANYRRAWSDSEFRTALWFTVEYTLVVTPILLFLGLGLALLVKRQTRSARFFQSVFFMPVVIGLASGSFLWLYMSQPQLGPLFDLMRRLGLVSSQGNWYGGFWSSLLIVVAMVTWKVVGLQMLLLLAGLQSIPTDVLEAARVDGANRLLTFRHITLPLLRPTLALVLVFSVAGSLLAFDQFFIMTRGAPSGRTISAVYQIYQVSFVRFDLGYGAALSVILMLILAVVSAVQLALVRNSDHS